MGSSPIYFESVMNPGITISPDGKTASGICNDAVDGVSLNITYSDIVLGNPSQSPWNYSDSDTLRFQNDPTTDYEVDRVIDITDTNSFTLFSSGNSANMGGVVNDADWTTPSTVYTNGWTLSVGAGIWSFTNGTYTVKWVNPFTHAIWGGYLPPMDASSTGGVPALSPDTVHRRIATGHAQL